MISNSEIKPHVHTLMSRRQVLEFFRDRVNVSKVEAVAFVATKVKLRTAKGRIFSLIEDGYLEVHKGKLNLSKKGFRDLNR